MNQITPGDDLSPEEAAAFVALPRLASTRDQLAEERTVQALRAAGLLAVREKRRPGRATAVGLGIAAALTLFVAGTMFGKELAARETRAASPSIQVQQAGTAYVAALVRLSSASDTERSPGLEAAVATLRAAASSLAQVNPGDPIALRLRTSLSDDNHPASDRSVIWF